MERIVKDNSFFAFFVSAVLATATIVVALQRPVIFPLIFIFVFVTTMVVGLPLF